MRKRGRQDAARGRKRERSASIISLSFTLRYKAGPLTRRLDGSGEKHPLPQSAAKEISPASLLPDSLRQPVFCSLQTAF